MFQKFLEKDLKAIFEKERVQFSNSSTHFGSELNTLFVIIEQDGIKNNFRDGENYFSINGSIEFLEDVKNTEFGFFNQRVSLSKYESAGNLMLLGRESNEQTNAESERLLISKSQSFLYKISIPYNPAIGEIEELTLKLE